MMVEIADPKSDDVICDPACGTSGFLVSAAEYLKETKKEEIFFDKDKKEHYMNTMFNGFDMDRTMLRIGAMNMMTHGIENPFIESVSYTHLDVYKRQSLYRIIFKDRDFQRYCETVY